MIGIKEYSSAAIFFHLSATWPCATYGAVHLCTTNFVQVHKIRIRKGNFAQISYLAEMLLLIIGA